jgi:hypothetical protein
MLSAAPRAGKEKTPGKGIFFPAGERAEKIP